MRIGFIGAGKVGFTLGKYFAVNGLDVAGYYSRNYKSAEEAAAFTCSEAFDSVTRLAGICDIIFLTVTDGNIREVAESLKEADISGKIICHCSGALSSEIFSDITGCTGYSVHPFFAINNKYDSYKELTSTLFTIEGPDIHRDCLASLIKQCGNKVIFIQPDMKARYHGAAVFASNLLMGLMETAVNELAACGFTKEDALTAIYPLALNNLKHLENNSLEDSLTGPLERNDVSTVRKHLECFKGDDRTIYILLSRKALEIAKRKNSDRDYREMEDLLYDNSHYTYEYEKEGR